jgi:hypothetical protein
MKTTTKFMDLAVTTRDVLVQEGRSKEAEGRRKKAFTVSF